MIGRLIESIDLYSRNVSAYTDAVNADRAQREKELSCLKEHDGSELKTILHLLNKIMATQKEVTADLQAVLVQLKKSDGEIKTLQNSTDALKQKITDLEGVIAAGGDASPELAQAVADVKAAAQVVDDDIPDAPVIPAINP
jgi:chromosome segregation ATPase